ncbi:HD domain-containing protein [Clostridium rectalis]|uniref:HD domain-containing protein n=1 Tax=Clostridium rectalis TaxID=2040295 RepID=UPI000F631198|nr:HD domain-containing protein [Clostridium rectalis]
MEKKFIEILNVVEQELSCSAHSMDHILRVHKLCLYLSKYEENVDKEILSLSALLHDIARFKEDSDSTRSIKHEVLGGVMAEKILYERNYDREKIDKVKHCILCHRYRSDNKPETVEAKILFDADKLDAIGAIGIARAYMLAGEFGQSIYLNISPEQYKLNNIMENGRIKDFGKHSVNMEYELKLKNINKRLHTEKAKEVSRKRLIFMENFFDELRNEVIK